MDKNRGSQDQKRLKVTVHHVTSPDAALRLSRAIDILLDTANTKHNSASSGQEDKQDVHTSIKNGR